MRIGVVRSDLTGGLTGNIIVLSTADGFRIRADEFFTIRGDARTRRDEFWEGEFTRALDNSVGRRGSGGKFTGR